jgi:cytochrome P450
MAPRLPPGPRLPRTIQTVAYWNRPAPFFERCRESYGNRFTVRLLQLPPFVHHADPGAAREVFTAPPDVLHPGRGARTLEPVVGPSSVILLDEDAHMRQRKLILPAFHGERMRRLAAVVAEVAEREVGGWPLGDPVPLHPSLQKLTLEVIMRAVFGVDPGGRFDGLRERLTSILAISATPAGMLPVLQRGRRWGDFVRAREEADALLFELIDVRRKAPDDERDDVLEMLLAARHEDGSPMSNRELRDELMTLLVAGHETTASELAWAFERLARTPAVLRRLTQAVDRDDDDYITATVQETLRRRPVLPIAAPRLVVEPVEIGGWTYPAGVSLAVNTYLIHHDASIYPDPYAFKPERFLDAAPGTYTWLPFGGGRRRCLGASFAQLEMKVVLRAVLARTEVVPAGDRLERTRRRGITVSPRAGALTVLRERVREPLAA